MERYLEESYQHIKNYISENETPELFEMCNRCERFCGTQHCFEECRDEPCFKMFLAYEYLRWIKSYE